MHGHEPGETLLFREGAFYFLVKCVKNESDSEWERYSLEIIEVLKNLPGINNYINIGTVFDVSNRVDSPHYVWHLRDPKSEEQLIARLRSERNLEIPKP